MPIGPSIDIPTFMPASVTAATRAASAAPDTLGMAEMMVWLQVTMSRTDADIRSQMTDINAKKRNAEELGRVLAAVTSADNIKAGGDGTGRNCSALKDILAPGYKETDWYKSLSDTAKANIDWLANDMGPDLMANEGAVKAARESLTETMSSISSSNEMAMIKLQSAISARGQAIQLISNMVNSFNETTKSIVGNIR